MKDEVQNCETCKHEPRPIGWLPCDECKQNRDSAELNYWSPREHTVGRTIEEAAEMKNRLDRVKSRVMGTGA